MGNRSRTVWLIGLLVLTLLYFVFGRSFPWRTQGQAERQNRFTSPSHPRPNEKSWHDAPAEDPVPAETLLHGASLTLYDVPGNTPEELQTNLAALNPTGSGTEGAVAYRFRLTRGNPTDGTCGLRSATVSADIQVRMPRWTPMPNSTPEAKQWWSFFIHTLAEAEQARIDRLTQEALTLTQQFRTSDCAHWEALWAGVTSKVMADQIGSSFAGSFAEPLESATVEVISTTKPESLATTARSAAPPATLDLFGIEGSHVALLNENGRVQLLNFWATWCGPCRAEIPSLIELYNSLRDQNIFFAFITDESPDKVRAFMQDHHWNLPVYTIAPGTAKAYIQGGYPTTWIISRRGETALCQPGAVRWDHPYYKKLLLDLLHE